MFSENTSKKKVEDFFLLNQKLIQQKFLIYFVTNEAQFVLLLMLYFYNFHYIFITLNQFYNYEHIVCLIPSARFVKTTRVDATIPRLMKQTHTSSSRFGPGSKMLRYVTCMTSSCYGACMHDLSLCL